MIECEKKILLNEQEYTFLKNFLQPFDSEHVQNNHYYDTLDLKMNQCGITCRIREKKGIYSVEIKQHSSDWQDISIENTESTYHEYNDEFFLNMGLIKHGFMKTYRCTLGKGDLEIALDKNDYLDFTDYELEVEYPAQFEDQAVAIVLYIAEALYSVALIDRREDFMQRVGICNNKSSRFFERKQVTKAIKAD